MPFGYIESNSKFGEVIADALPGERPFVDDILKGHIGEDELFRWWVDVVAKCKQKKLAIKASKIWIGITQAEFIGMDVYLSCGHVRVSVTPKYVSVPGDVPASHLVIQDETVPWSVPVCV